MFQIVKDRRPPVYTRYNRRNRKRSLSSLADMSALFPDVSVQSGSDIEFRPDTSFSSHNQQQSNNDDDSINGDEESSLNGSESSYASKLPNLREPTCAVRGCNSTKSDSTKGILLHRYPREISMKNIWRRALKGKTQSKSKIDFICSKHFESKYIDNHGSSSYRLASTAIPTIFPVPDNKPQHSHATRYRETIELPKAGGPLNFAKEFLKDEENSKNNKSIDPNNLDNDEFAIKQHQKIKMLHEKIRRKNRKIELLKEFIRIYEQKMKPNETGVLFSGIPSEFFHQQIVKLTSSSNNTSKFSEELEKFSTNLYSISPSAYNYVREAFDYVLPSSKKIKTKEEKLENDVENEIIGFEGENENGIDIPEDDDFDDDYDDDDEEEDDHSYEDDDDDVIIQEDEIDNVILIDDQ